MPFADFIAQVKDFGKRFFKQMCIQVQLAIDKDCGSIQMDKKQFVEEHDKREKEFHKQISILEHKSTITSNWEMVDELYRKMQKDLKKKINT